MGASRPGRGGRALKRPNAPQADAAIDRANQNAPTGLQRVGLALLTYLPFAFFAYVSLDVHSIHRFSTAYVFLWALLAAHAVSPMGPWPLAGQVGIVLLMTGRYPAEDRLPIASQFPYNLFTLLGKSYDVEQFQVLQSGGEEGWEWQPANPALPPSTRSSHWCSPSGACPSASVAMSIPVVAFYTLAQRFLEHG